MDKNSYIVVIPAYNAAATIVAAVESCLKQTRPPDEVIVVNDGSADGTEALLRSRFGDAVRIISLPVNSGPSAARNAGIAAAAGTHILFQDADDLWHREKLACIDSVLRARTDICFLFHPYTLKPIDFKPAPAELAPRRLPVWKLLLSNPIGTPCVAIRNHPRLRFNEQLHFMEDYELFLREAARTGVYQIDAPLTQLGRPILSKGGQSSSRWQMRIGEMRAWASFARQHPAWLIVLPFLFLLSLLKHIVKSFFPPRTNY